MPWAGPFRGAHGRRGVRHRCGRPLTDAQVDTWQCANSPALPEDPDPILGSPAAMFAHAQRQTVYGKRRFPGQAIGGRFFVA